MSSPLLAAIERACATFGNRPALLSADSLSADQIALSYGALHQAIGQRHRWLQAAGLPARARIALLLPNGLPAALETLAILTRAVCVPLNPAITETQLRAQLADCSVDVLLHDRPADPVIARVLQDLGLPSITASRVGTDLIPVWTAGPPARSLHPRPPADDTCLILQTSGTTGQPKRVPLSPTNRMAAAQAIATQLALTPEDRALNMLPLFHVHGLVGSLLASLQTGGSIICTAGFEHAKFAPWLETLAPTWYTATPTIHQAALSVLDEAGIAAPGRLRFIRSASSPLAPDMIDRLERRFKVPVIEAYGATEASSPISSNPLPPAVRKVGSVGRPCGTAVRIIDSAGLPTPLGERGEIMVRGPGVISAYEPDYPAEPPDGGVNDTASPFVNGWFRTGDLGHFDSDGYLFIDGRIKEQINRGGEKISPREIDDALMAIDGIAQAAAFAVPHPTLGEDLAAAVVLCQDSRLTEDWIRAQLGCCLEAGKVPTSIHLVSDLPRNINGKIQRQTLAAMQWPKHSQHDRARAPADALTMLVMGVWEAVLGEADLTGATDFFQAGGDSLQAARVIARLNAACQIDLPATALFGLRTIERLVAAIRNDKGSNRAAHLPDDEFGAPGSLTDIDSLSDEEVERELIALSSTTDSP